MYPCYFVNAGALDITTTATYAVVYFLWNLCMLSILKKVSFFALLITIYGVLLYFLITLQVNSDFSSFYASALAYSQNLDPYQNLTAAFLPIPTAVPVNLNPPFFLQIITPLTAISFAHANVIWILFSLVFGGVGALLSFKFCLSPEFFRKHWLYLLFIYLGMHATMMNTGFAQLGGPLLFIIMMGYGFFLRKQDGWAGIFWGFSIAIKLFPVLLCVFVWQQKRYKLFGVMLIVSVLCCMLPLITKGTSNYLHYAEVFTRIFWYGDNWNASIYGFLFRVFIGAGPSDYLLPIKIMYLGISFGLIVWYYRKIDALQCTQSDHRAFALTLVLMLLISPFGWLYYFSLLLMPLTLIWQTVRRTDLFIWAMCLFLINFPSGYVHVVSMGGVLSKVSYYSFHFYGLVLCLILASRLPSNDAMNERSLTDNLYPVQIVLGIGLVVYTISLSMQMS